LQEDVLALQADLDTVDGQLERVQAQLAEVTERYKALKADLAIATEALEKWELQGEQWALRDAERVKSDERVMALESEMGVMAKEMLELRAAVAEGEEDKARLKERLETLAADYESRLANETSQRDTTRAKVDAAEKEARQTKEELAEVTRTATDYAAMIARKDAEVARLSADMASMRRERESALKQATELQAQTEQLNREVVAQKQENERTKRLQAELDELRTAMDAKTSEDHKRSEVERSRELELADLRAQVSRASQELNDALKGAGESQAALRTIKHERDELLAGKQLLVKRADEGERKASEMELLLGAAEKARRTAESELAALRMRQVDLDTQLADAVKGKEVSSFRGVRDKFTHSLLCPVR
jgi:myosin heavy chain 9/10/11/14